jgi:hypothetical protein
MRPRKIAKPLERAARAVKDSDEFVQHVAGIADRYRREIALEEGLRDAELRRALKSFRKHAQALVEWLGPASRAKKTAVETRAFSAMLPALNRAPLRAEVQDVLNWLVQADAAAEGCLSQHRSAAAQQEPSVASRIAAEGLRATFEHHQLSVSTAGSKQNPSPAVTLLCAIAKSAGDSTLTPEAAKRVIVESGKKSAA